MASDGSRTNSPRQWPHSALIRRLPSSLSSPFGRSWSLPPRAGERASERGKDPSWIHTIILGPEESTNTEGESDEGFRSQRAFLPLLPAPLGRVGRALLWSGQARRGDPLVRAWREDARVGGLGDHFTRDGSNAHKSESLLIPALVSLGTAVKQAGDPGVFVPVLVQGEVLLDHLRDSLHSLQFRNSTCAVLDQLYLLRPRRPNFFFIDYFRLERRRLRISMERLREQSM